jgi:hypothetical protein
MRTQLFKQLNLAISDSAQMSEVLREKLQSDSIQEHTHMAHHSNENTWIM